MLSRYGFKQYLKDNRYEFVDAPMEVVKHMLTGKDAITVCLRATGNDRAHDRLVVSRFNRNDGRVEVKYRGNDELWTVDELEGFLKIMA